jgi:chemotaxis protein histidine kinase CheA
LADVGKIAVKVRLYRFRNVLKEKTAGPGGGAPGAALVIDPKALEAANSALEKMSEDYPDWVGKIIVELREHLVRCIDSPTDRQRRFAMIRQIAHDMKGQGGTFGYPLMTAFASSLVDCVGPRSGTADNHVEIVKSHIDAMSAVIKDRVKGNGGEIGKALTQGLKDAIEKHSKVT